MRTITALCKELGAVCTNRYGMTCSLCASVFCGGEIGGEEGKKSASCGICLHNVCSSMLGLF